MSLIKIEHLRKEYPNATPLKDVNAEINAGDVISVIGPSNSGKSTLLRCLYQLEKPTSGKVFFDGTEITSPDCPIDFIRRKMGMVTQSISFFPNLNIIENVMTAPINILKMPKQKAYDEGMELLKRVGLTERALNSPADLTEGEKQRAAIARAMAMKPEVLLFDETISSLNPAMVAEVVQVIKKLASEGMTMLVVTHEMNFAREISNRVFYMDEGVIYEEGAPEQIFDNPGKEKTGAYIKRLNQLNLEIKNAGYDFAGFTSELERYARDLLLPEKLIKNIRLVFEEIVSQNLVPYSEVYYNEYPIKIVAEMTDTDDRLRMNINYSGMQYDPTEGTVDLSAVIVKNIAENVNYTYENGINNIDILFKKAA